MAFTQYASIGPRFSSPGDRHTTRVIRALQRLGSFGDRPRIARSCDSVRSEQNASHLNLGSSLTAASSASAARSCSSAPWPPDAQAHWQASFQGFVAVVLEALVPDECKAGMASDAMGLDSRRDGAGEDEVAVALPLPLGKTKALSKETGRI
nr:unnamed protein product [Digitaria exilis]